MLGKIKSYLIIILLTSSFLFLAVGKTGASDASITCGDSGCTGITGAIFNETNLTPGENISKTLTATNNYSQVRSFALGKFIEVEFNKVKSANPVFFSCDYEWVIQSIWHLSQAESVRGFNFPEKPLFYRFDVFDVYVVVAAYVLSAKILLISDLKGIVNLFSL